jgi:hypothetical protein
MKRFTLCLAASLILFASTSYAPAAHASRQFSILTDYWTSPSVHNGYSYLPCVGTLQTDGTLSGEWKEVSTTNCETLEMDYHVYHYCSGTWVEVAYLGDTSC